MRLSFGFVGVEQRLRCRTVENVGQLPGEVERVTQSRAESLSDKRWCLMSGVAGEEDSTVAPGVSHPCAKGVDGLAHDLRIREFRRGHPRRQQLLQRLLGSQCIEVLAVVHTKLPAVSVSRDRHERRSAVGVADLVDTAPYVERCLGEDVDHQPPFVEVEVAHGDTELVAHKAVGPVAPDHRGRIDEIYAAIAVLIAHHRPCATGDIGDLATTPQVDQVDGVCFVEENTFEVGLVEHASQRVAVGAVLGAAGELGHHSPSSVDQPHARHRPGVRRELLVDADGLQYPEHLVVEVHRPR